MADFQLSMIQTEPIVEAALAEDLGWGDITTEALIPKDLKRKGTILAKAKGMLAGIELARMVFHKIDPSLRFQAILLDGAKLKPKEIIATVEGSVASILKGERVALNFLQRLSGIASETARCVDAVSGLPAVILDTRKTTPGLRVLEKYAVRVGGGKNHRLHLGDGVLIKDNHLAALQSLGISMKEAISNIRSQVSKRIKIEVEAQTVEQALQAVEAGTDILMLDNMSLETMRQAVESVRGCALIEASGGITLDNIRRVAETGVDFISIGALTHSVKSLDISLELEI